MIDLTWADILLRTLAAAGLGAVMGLEREAGRHPAGVRTHALVALGAALFTATGGSAFGEADAARVAAQVVTGIGFVGAGAILRTGNHVRGLTTAATLWVAAAIGLACGAGAFAHAAVATLVVLVVLVSDRIVRPLLGHRRQLEVDYERGHGTLGPILRHVAEQGGRIVALHLDDMEDPVTERPIRRAQLDVMMPRGRRGDDWIDTFRRLPEVIAVRWNEQD